MHESVSRLVSRELRCASFGESACSVPFWRGCSAISAALSDAGWISPLAREEVVEGGERGVGVVVMMGTGEEGEVRGGEEGTKWRSKFSWNFPFSMLVMVNDLFFGTIWGLVDGSRLDMQVFRLESDPVLFVCLIPVPEWDSSDCRSHRPLTGEQTLFVLLLPDLVPV